MAVQLGTKLDGSDLWTLPIEPIVSIDAANEVVRRGVAKGYLHGSVKESWNRADYEISIDGVFIADPNADGSQNTPSNKVAKLNDWLSRGKSLKIVSQATQDVGVDQVAVLAWSFPHTPGVQNQRYSIKCVSDYPFELIV